MKKAVVFLTAALLSCVAFGGTDNNLPAPYLSVSGTGEASLPPDIAMIQVEVSLIKKSGMEAKQQVDAAVNALLDSLTENKPNLSRIDAGSLRLQPHYEYDNNKRRQKGYMATRMVDLEVSALDVMDSILETVVKQGMTTVRSVDYGFSDGGRLCQQQALDKAISDSKDQAQRMAEAYGVKLGKLSSAGLGSSYPSPYAGMEKMAMADASSRGPSYRSGDITCHAQVSAVFLIKE